MRYLHALSVLLFLSLFAQNSFSQQKINIGYFQSFPLGSYGSTDLSTGSFAEPGWGVMVESRSGMPNFPEGLYLSLHYSYQYNNFNSNAFASGLDEVLGGGLSSRVAAASYNPSVITLGPVYEWEPLSRLTVEAKAGAGIMITNIDPIVISIFDDQGNNIISEVLRFESKPTITYLAGVHVSYHLSKILNLGLFAEHSFANEEIKTTFGGVEGINSRFSILYINAGLMLSLTL